MGNQPKALFFRIFFGQLIHLQDEVVKNPDNLEAKGPFLRF